LANFAFDQAEGLRRMLAGPRPRVLTFLSAASAEEKDATLINLGASLAQAGRDVLLFDACGTAEGISAHLDAVRGASLMQAACKERVLEEVIQQMPQGFGVAALRRGAHRTADIDDAAQERLDQAFNVLAKRVDMVVVDAELDQHDAFPLAALAGSEIVIQVVNNSSSIKSAYGIIKRLNSRFGRRPFSILVTGASEKEARVVYENMAQAANRYLAVKLNSMGSVPADEHLKRAMKLGRAVIDAYPLAGASVAFRQLAGRLVLSDMAAAG
jgi:flagellar biosynthesis protein FlhG